MSDWAAFTHDFCAELKERIAPLLSGDLEVDATRNRCALRIVRRGAKPTAAKVAFGPVGRPHNPWPPTLGEILRDALKAKGLLQAPDDFLTGSPDHGVEVRGGSTFFEGLYWSEVGRVCAEIEDLLALPKGYLKRRWTLSLLQPLFEQEAKKVFLVRLGAVEYLTLLSPFEASLTETTGATIPLFGLDGRTKTFSRPSEIDFWLRVWWEEGYDVFLKKPWFLRELEEVPRD